MICKKMIVMRVKKHTFIGKVQAQNRIAIPEFTAHIMGLKPGDKIFISLVKYPSVTLHVRK
jgi:hypothetical protein